ncbi:MAG: hypothetical protein M3Y51_02885 [Actinomycetota bacterium]|nr:hypothetical protein [Actinomycetota bacterium]
MIDRFSIPEREQIVPFLGGVIGALTWDGAGPTALQLELLDAVVRRFALHDVPDVHAIDAWPSADVRAALPSASVRDQLAHVVVALELMMHPLPVALERHVERYLIEVGVHAPYVSVLRDTAAHHVVRLHADLVRNSWYTEQTIKGMFSGRFEEMVRSKLSYYSVAKDERLASRWRALERCPEGSWGRGVADFYLTHGFAYPGEHTGIYEIGALHDWVHVLADYGTDPEGEIDVFAFISATMTDQRGFLQFIFTLALFQNGTIDTVGGRKVKIARADTLAEPGATDRLADSLYRAANCTADVMGGVDHFALATRQLDELREEWNIPPKRFPSPGYLDRPGVNLTGIDS